MEAIGGLLDGDWTTNFQWTIIEGIVGKLSPAGRTSIVAKVEEFLVTCDQLKFAKEPAKVAKNWEPHELKNK